jgi:two-component system LytT family response regulator
MAAANSGFALWRVKCEYETLLIDFGFFRIHQSTIVNLRHVKSYFKGDGGSVEMTDGKQVQVSRYRKANFIKKFI